MPHNGDKDMDGLAATIRRQVGAERITRYLRSLPQLRLDDDLPEEIGRLLSELDRAEARAKRGIN